MQRINESLKSIYNDYFYVLFFIFLLGTLSFGRAFSILHINLGPYQLFITEIILLSSYPFFFINFKAILNIPKGFTLLILTYFLLGFIHLLFGLISGNFFAMRDAVLCFYSLFFFISYVLFSYRKIGKPVLLLLLISNLISVLIGQAYISGFRVFLKQWAEFLMTTRITNLCFYYGLTLSFLISYLCFLKNSKLVNFFFFICVLNFYPLLFLSSRAAWVSSFFLGIFFISLLRMKFIKVLIVLVPFFILVATIFHYYNYNFTFIPHEQKEAFFLKIDSVPAFLENRQSILNVEKSGTPTVVPEPPTVVRPQPKPVYNSHISKGDPEEYDNLTFRILIWKTAFNFGLESPLWGKGFGVYPNYLNWDRTPMKEPRKTFLNSNVIPTHNHLVSIFYKMGLLGLFLFLLVNLSVFVYGLRYLRVCKQVINKVILTGALGAIVFWHSMALFFDIIDSPPTSIFIWILLGLVLACIAVDKKSEHL